jgi:teichuronic acid biosynthesis glycosyltransferase TuaC
MRILFLSSVFPNAVDPSRGCFNDSLVRALAIAHQVEVVSPIPWVDLLKGCRRGIQLPIYQRIADSVGFGIHYVPFLYPPKVLRRWYGKFYWSSIAATVQSLIRTVRPDLVIGYWAHPDGEGAVRIGRMVGAPSCVIVGGSDVLLMTRKPSRRRRIQKVLQATDCVITVNEDLKNAVVSLGISADKVHVWHQGIDASRFRPGDRKLARQQLGIPSVGRIMIWVGRMVPVKGLDILLDSCALLRDRGVEYHLYFVGDGPLRADLVARTEARRLAAHVTFTGPKLHDELADWYRAADLTVLPSRSEGLPNVLRESLACGTPFVATNVGGISEIAVSGSSVLVPAEDRSSLADAIEKALSRWGRNEPLISVSVQSWEESANAFVEIMQRYVRPVALRGYTEKEASGVERIVPEFVNSDEELPAVVQGRVSLVRGRALGIDAEVGLGGELQGALNWGRRAIRRILVATLPRSMLLTQGPRRRNSVCLTFDDGPDSILTPRLLDVLRDHGVRATFFVVGEKVERHPEIIRRMGAEGHCVGSHSFHHKAPASTSARQLLAEVRRTSALLAELLGHEETLFRPPHGRLTASKLSLLWMARRTVVLWSVDPKDYLCRDAGQVRDWFSNRPLRGGDIVLFHDRIPHAIDVLPSLIEEARARGLGFTIPGHWRV